jgi:hypothetical protein
MRRLSRRYSRLLRQLLVPASDKDNSSWASADFSGLNDPRALRRFIDVYDYLLDNGDSDDDDYELTWP